MYRDKEHFHPCNDCRNPTRCDGELEQNYDGWPEVICDLYHENDGGSIYGFLCEECEIKAEAAFVKDQQEQAEEEMRDSNLTDEEIEAGIRCLEDKAEGRI